MRKLSKTQSVAQHKDDDLVHLRGQLEEKLAWIQGKSRIPEKDLAARALKAWLAVIRELTRTSCTATAK